MIDKFIASYKTAPKRLILDFGATDDEVHGKFYHGYYGHNCFLPLYVFCKKQLLVNYLRTSNHDQARHACEILSLLVKRFRQAWPEVKIIFRGDSGFWRHRMLDWCDSYNVQYIVETIRLKLLKIGVVIIRNSRRIKFLLSSSYPYQLIWNHVMKKLALE